MLRRVKNDVLPNLVKKEEVVIKCPMSGMQIAMYDQLQEHKRLQYKKDLKLQRFSNATIQLQKISNHPYMFQQEECKLCNLSRTTLPPCRSSN